MEFTTKEEIALTKLIEYIVDRNMEFPDAELLVVKEYNIKAGRIRELYDNQESIIGV